MEVIKQNNKNESYKEFESLLSEDLNNRPFREGEIVEGTITRIEDKYCFLSLNLKSEGAVAIEEFALTKELDLMKVGAKVKVLIEKLEDFSGNLVISREAARKVSSWKRVEKSFHEKKEARGYIISRCKSGWVCDIGGVLAFLPNSQVDLKPLSNIDHLIKKEQVFEVVKLDKRRGNIVVSRRAILEKQRNKNKDELLSKIKVGDIVEGVVKGIVDWGVFLDLNGVDALLHITDISWSRVNKPSELVELSSVLKVKVTKIRF